MHALETLADDGFAWRDIARVMGVSVPAITKWREGAGVTGENRLKLARLLALIDMLSDRFIEEPASWLEMPIKAGVGITRMDLLERGRYHLVLALASTHTGDGTVEYVLNETGQNWRETFVEEDARVRYDSIAFLRRFVEGLTLPVVLDGREHIEYVPTQVFTEYLRYSFPALLDGLVFPSVQGPGCNCVIFCGPRGCSGPDEVAPRTRLILNPRVSKSTASQRLSNTNEGDVRRQERTPLP
jgi:hypothetical protein